MKPLNPPKRLLMGPGPSMVAPRVYAAMAQPIVGYLDPYCLEIIGDIQQMLRVAFGTISLSANIGTILTHAVYRGAYSTLQVTFATTPGAMSVSKWAEIPLVPTTCTVP